MGDGDLIFNTGIDNSGFNSGISNLQMIANTALGNIAADIAAKAAQAAAEIPRNIFASGTGFESQLSTVQSISMASSEEMDMLKDKAAEMGAATSFSATESALAFEYMAAAGWKTEDMLSGIDGIMALSAASGESLAGTSDIVTDALTAFGMTAADSAGFADMLSAAAAASNTNVAMLGESFKYVAPLFGAMSYSAEDASVALGLMANAGMEDGSHYASMLLKKSDKDLAELNETYAEINSMIDESGNDLYGDKLEAVNTGFVSEVKALVGTIPAELQGIGLESAAAWVEGLNLSSEQTIESTEQFCNDLITAVSEGIDAGTLSKETADDFVDGFISELTEKSPDMMAAIDSAFNTDDISTNVKATVDAEMSTTSAKFTAGSSATGNEQANNSRTMRSGTDIDKLLAGINIPVNFYISEEKIGQASIRYANKQSRQTGGVIIK